MTPYKYTRVPQGAGAFKGRPGKVESRLMLSVKYSEARAEAGCRTRPAGKAGDE